MYRAFPGSDYYADSATPRQRQPASGLAGALPTFTVIRSTGPAVGSTPAAPPGSSRSVSPAIKHRSEPARSDLPSSRARSLLRPAHVRQIWGWSANRGASTTASLCLSVSLARARASGSTTRPSRCQGCSHRSVRDPAPRLPPASPRRCIGPGPASPPARTEMSCAPAHLLSHSPSWRTKEVAGQHPVRLRAQELRPGRAGSPRGRPQPMPAKERADRGRIDPDAELAQLALDPDAAPARVLARRPQHQLAALTVQRRPARRSAPIRPLLPHELPLPAQKRLRRDYERRPSPTRQQAAGRSEDDPIPTAQLRSLSRSAAAHSAGVAAPRSPPRARQRPNRLRPRGSAGVRASAPGRRSRRPDPTDTHQRPDRGFRPLQAEAIELVARVHPDVGSSTGSCREARWPQRQRSPPHREHRRC